MDMMGKSILKALVAKQMLVTISIDVINRFRSKCIKHWEADGYQMGGYSLL